MKIENKKSIGENSMSEKDFFEQFKTQLRKGWLDYLVLYICKTKKYPSEVIQKLSDAKMIVAEGTIYPLLLRLYQNKFLEYNWQESNMGPPRKYYITTKKGNNLLRLLDKEVNEIDLAIKKIIEDREEK